MAGKQPTDLLSFALNHARKTGSNANSYTNANSSDDKEMLSKMISSAVTRPANKTVDGTPQTINAGSSSMLEGRIGPSADDDPSATRQLMALLVAAINRPDIVHADEAEASSSEEEDGDDDEHPGSTPPLANPSALVSTATPKKGRTPPHSGGGSSGGGGHLSHSRETPRTTSVIHDGEYLSTEQRVKARNPDALVAEIKELLAAGADASGYDADGNSTVYLALHVPNTRAALTIAHELLRRGASPHARRHGGTLLDHALRLGRAPLVQRLLRAGAYPYRKGEPQQPPARRRLDALSIASGFGDEASACMKRAMRAAAARDDAKAARGLLLHGCPVENELLYALVRKRRAPKVVGALLNGGADPNYSDAIGTHLLALVTLQGDVALTKVLLAAGADPLVEEDNGQSVLELAKTQATVPEIVRLMENAIAEREDGADAEDDVVEVKKEEAEKTPSTAETAASTPFETALALLKPQEGGDEADHEEPQWLTGGDDDDDAEDDDEEPIWLTEEPTPPKAASKKRTNRVAWPEKAKEKEEKEKAGASSRKSARTPKPKWLTK